MTNRERSKGRKERNRRSKGRGLILFIPDCGNPASATRDVSNVSNSSPCRTEERRERNNFQSLQDFIMCRRYATSLRFDARRNAIRSD